MSAHAAPLADFLPGALKELAPALAARDARDVAALLAPFVARLREGIEGPPKEAVDAVSVVCRALYGHGRIGEALPLARSLREHCRRAGDQSQTRRAAFLCAMALAETADLVGAIEHYVEALRIAAGQDDRVEMGRVWGNLGLAFIIPGRYELAARSLGRCLALLEPLLQPSSIRRIALSNLAMCHYHLGQIDEGLRCADLAFRELEGLDGEDPHGIILLRRNAARLLLERGRVEEAGEHVAHAIVLAQSIGSPRAAIAAEITRAAYDLATGSAEIALTRIDSTLARARQVPATLHDALACAVRAEGAAGYPARALLRLQELSEHTYSYAVDRARAAVKRAGLEAADTSVARSEIAREELATRLEPPAPPKAWPTLRRLAASAVLPMDPTGWHGVRVGTLVRALAVARGCPPLQALELGLASELHDVGLSSVPAAVLAKPTAFNAEERRLVGQHAQAGAAMLVNEPHPRLLLARDIARYHHARWDGAGDPEHVGGAAIPLGARMCAIADAYDAMVCGLGRPAISMAAALAELRRCSGQQFDPELVSCFDAVVNGELEGLGLDPASPHGMEAFQELVAALREDRGFA